jgi:SAM-dependent methyltransferase
MAPPQQQKNSRATARWSDDLRADAYDSQGNRVFYQSALTTLLEGAPTLAGRGVDLGCGTGFATEVLRAKYPDVTWQGIDVADAMLALARRKPGLASVSFCQASAEALPLADGSMDVVVANFSWHWFGQDAGREARRVLRPGGWLLATVPLRLFSAASGNRALARALLADRRQFAHTSSQGLRFEATRSLLPGPMRVARHELRIGQETFADGREMLDVLGSRGALSAIFGDHPPSAIDAGSPLDLPFEFTWPFALVHLQVVG